MGQADIAMGERSWFTYRVFGLTLASRFPFVSNLITSAGAPDLTFQCVTKSPLAIGWNQVAPAYASRCRIDRGESTYYLYRSDTCDVVRFTGIADFYTWNDRILCHPLSPIPPSLLESFFLGSILSFWLERRGVIALHASANVVKGRTVAFVSISKGGKSSLNATLMQAGHPMLTDDILPIDHRCGNFWGRPGYPQMRLWPDEARHFLGHYQDLERVHPAYSKRRVPIGPGSFGAFCDTPQPLACLYLPQRCDPEIGTQVHVLPVSPRDAVIELVRHSFTPRIVEAMGLQQQRLDTFSRIVRTVPVRRLIYPSGLQHLERVREAVLEDLEQCGRGIGGVRPGGAGRPAGCSRPEGQVRPGPMPRPYQTPREPG